MLQWLVIVCPSGWLANSAVVKKIATELHKKITEAKKTARQKLQKKNNKRKC